MKTEIFSPRKKEIASIRIFKVSLHQIRDVLIPYHYEKEGQRYATLTELCNNDLNYSDHLKTDSEPRCIACNYGFERGDLYFYGYYNNARQLCIRRLSYGKVCIKCGLKRLSQITPKSLLKQYRDFVKSLLPKNEQG